MSQTCNHKGCDRAATHHVGMRAWATGFPKTTPPARFELGIPLCKSHARSTTVDDVITDDGWEIICHQFRKLGRVLPDRSTLEIFPVKGLPKAGSDVKGIA